MTFSNLTRPVIHWIRRSLGIGKLKTLKTQMQQQAVVLQQLMERQQAIAHLTTRIRTALDVEVLFQSTTEDVCHLLQVEQVAVYRFNPDWGGAFVQEWGFTKAGCGPNSPLGENLIWNDTLLQETKGGRYRHNETAAVADIYSVELSQCHIEILEQFQIRAYAIVPIFVGKTLWGLLAAYQHSAPHVWQDSDIQFLAHIATHLGIALQQADLRNQAQQQADNLQVVTDQQRVLAGMNNQMRTALDIHTLDIHTLFQGTTEEVCKLLKVERVAVYRFYPDWGGEFVSEYGFEAAGFGAGKPFGQNLVWNDTYLQENRGGRYRHNESFAVADIYGAELTQCHIEILEQFQIRAYAVAPIFVGQTLWGLLGAYQYAAPHRWQEAEIQFLTRSAVQLGMALHHADLLIQANQETVNAHQLAEQQQILFSVVAKIRESLDLETIFKTTAEEVRRSLAADRVGVFRFEPGTDYCFGEFVSEDVLPDFDSALRAKVRDHCFGEQYAVHYAQGQIQVVGDIHAAGLQDCHIAVLTQFQIRAQIIVPLLKGPTLWGLLCIHQCSRARQWQEPEVQFVSQVAAQLGMALQQADLLTQTQQRSDALAEALQHLKQAQIQMVQSEKMASLGQMVAGIAHEINNPVNFIYGNLNHIDEYMQDILQFLRLYQSKDEAARSQLAELAESLDLEFIRDDLPKILDSMKLGTNRIREIVLSLRNFSRLDQAEIKAVDLHEGIDSTLMILHHRVKAKTEFPEIKIIRHYGELPLVECYAGQLNQVFMNLLSNAIDALESNRPNESPVSHEQGEAAETALAYNPPEIQISTRQVGDRQVEIRIADNGPGIPEVLLPRLFDPFFTTKPIGKGTGLGLSISQQIIVEQHGGTLTCQSGVNQGTEFVITLPLQMGAPVAVVS